MAEQRSDQKNTSQMNGKDPPKYYDSVNSHRNKAEVTKPTSLSTLILWNISKALEKNPVMDIKGAIKRAQALLDRERDVSAMIPDSAEQRHLACAVLAWQQLGHSDADSLCQFIANKTNEQENISAVSSYRTSEEASARSSQESEYTKCVNSMSFGSNSIGPVVKLPTETKIVMRMENSPSARQPAKKPKGPVKDTMNKIEAACCLDSACADRLAKMDTATTELRMRAGTLARREAERVELLERAEAAWRDLELGYQRRLTLAEEKEDDFTKQIQKAIEERNGFKNACTALALQLKEKGEKAEKDRTALSQVEKLVCERACLRLKLSEESAQTDAIVAEHQCRAAQLDRDLQFKEEQARRKLLNFQSELESSQTITHETERAMRAELGALREQIAQVSEQLLEEDSETTGIKQELEYLRQEKLGMVEDLEGCKAMCDSRMQGKVDELKNKRDQLAALKDRVMECRCKLPVDVTVEVKRTASLAALCRCTPEDKILESCSCTSLRGKLLSNLLADLFSGLQAEMGGTGTQMPCQLLKCLEDRHNWERASIVKTNLKNYFAQLLIGELDIAIATSIEKYHAKWVGQSCADTARMIPDPGEVENEGWQERAIERRAQNLATKLAEQLFQERADQLTQRAKAIVASGPPPCNCKPQAACCKDAPAVYPVLVKSILPAPVNGPTTPANTPAYWRQTMQDVTQLRVQIEDLKKDSLKKEDLKLMEEKITKIVQRGSGIGRPDTRLDTSIIQNAAHEVTIKKEQKINRAVNSNQANYYSNINKIISLKKKQIETNPYKKGLKANSIQQNGSDKTFKPYKKLGQTYAINMCMCSQKDPSKIAGIQNKITNDSITEEGKGVHRKDRASKDSMPLITGSVKQTKPISSSLQSQDISIRSNNKSLGQQSCKSNCKCFHKIPSNTSIDKLLETLAKWKSDLSQCETEKECENETPCCNFLPGSEISNMFNKKPTLGDQKNVAGNKNSLNNIQKESKVLNIEEKSGTNSKMSSRSIPFIEKTEQINISEKRSSIKNRSFAKASNDVDKEKKVINIKANKNTSATSSNDINKDNKKSNLNKGVCCDSSFIAPTTTVSEYMGAINLDKSNEDFCKCVNNNKTQLEPPNEPFQCMPCKCSCKILKIKKDVTQDGEGTEVHVTKTSQQGEVGKNITNDTQKNVRSEIKKKTEIFPCDCGYDIQFLGVTLTDVISDNQEEVPSNEKDTEKCCEMGCVSYNSVTSKSLTSYCDNNNKHKVSSKETNNNKNIEGGEKIIYTADEKNQPTGNIKQMASIKETNYKINKDEVKIKVKEKNDCEKCTSALKNRMSIRETNPNKNILDKTGVVNKEYSRSTPSGNKESIDELNNNRDVAFKIQQTNKDKGFDVQSFRDIKYEEESCVCCDKQNVDDSNDLEENAFHLLEEHLKKKLAEFKESSCNSTCIPQGEEEKLFTTILKRVKQVIIDSTNKIACKCLSEEENSKGSWNRAYGLLQEYLKTKIKRVQCSCVKEEDNNEKILPEVLDKVCNLIENDFQRLKDVCGCKKSEVLDNDSRQVNFKEHVPERDNDFFNTKANEIYRTSCSQNPQTSVIIKENNSSQVPAYLGMVTKSCNPLETYAKNVQTLHNVQPLDTTTYCNSCEKKVDAELIGTTEFKKSSESTNSTGQNIVKPVQFANLPYIAYASECVCKNIECTNYTVPANNNTARVNDDGNKKPTSNKNDNQRVTSIYYNKPIHNSKFEITEIGILKQNEETDSLKLSCDKAGKNKDAELLGFNESKTSQPSKTKSVKSVCNCHPKSSFTCFQNNETANINDSGSKTLAYFPNKPYIGYTIDCSCDIALGACVCTKSIIQTDNCAMDNIMKKSLPNDKYYEKVSYIMKSNPTENTNYHNDLLSDITGDLYLHNVLKHKTLYEDELKQDGETEASFNDDEDIILKGSREYFEMAHTTTNTFDDNVSLDTDYSNTDAPLDWCECCSQIPLREMNSNQLKKSIYFPIPLGNDNHLKSDIENDNCKRVPKTLPKYCDCDLVPICHVKMLVENIENKLVSANCTCDSMIPKVCPIHSTKC